MDHARTTFIASLIVIVSGVLWGFYWLPVRYLETLGIAGPWGTAGIAFTSVCILTPFALRHTWRNSDWFALASIIIGGVAFALYSIGFIYGRVAIIAILFYLTPVWSTLLTRYVLGWDTPRTRLLAIGAGLLGLTIMLGAQGDWPIPRNLGEWMALASGIFWSLSSTGMRMRAPMPATQVAFVFVTSATVTAIGLGLALAPAPWSAIAQTPVATIGVASLTGFLWWTLAIIGLMWSTARLDPARVGILLMAEVLIGAGSAVVLAGEHLSALEVGGGLLVVLAGFLEVWPSKTKHADA